MSNLLDRPLLLIPASQRLEMSSKPWTPQRGWEIFDLTGGKKWALARNERDAVRLLSENKLPCVNKPEGYALWTLGRGAVGIAADAAGLAHSRTTLSQLLQLAGDGAVPQAVMEDWPDLGIRGIQLDLKYMMHRKDYLCSWLEDLVALKINTLLLEYEDKLPYREHAFLRHPWLLQMWN